MRNRNRRRCLAAALMAGGIVIFAGCATTSSAFSDLRSERTPVDDLPALAEDAYENIDTSTSRYAGEHEGTSLWIAEGQNEFPICLIAVSTSSDWAVACGGPSVVGMSGLIGTYTVVPDGTPAPEHATRISENVYAGVSIVD